MEEVLWLSRPKRKRTRGNYATRIRVRGAEITRTPHTRMAGSTIPHGTRKHQDQSGRGWYTHGEEVTRARVFVRLHEGLQVTWGLQTIIREYIYTNVQV